MGKAQRAAVVSIAFGVAAALVVARIGPFYATRLLIAALPVVFLTISRAATGSTIRPGFKCLPFAFAVAWLVRMGSRSDHPQFARGVARLGALVIAMLGAMALFVRRRRLAPHDRYLHSLTDRALTEISDVAGSLGRAVKQGVTEAGARLTAVIGAGLWNLNAAVVDLEITSLGSKGCSVVSMGTAKEGLIKPRAGEGAVRGILAATGFGSLRASDISER